MIARSIALVLKWAAALGLIAGLLSVTYWANSRMQAERAREGDEERVQSPRRTRDGVVELGLDDAARYGLAEAPARAVAWTEQVSVYGEVVANPAAAAEVRAPFAGVLRNDPSAAWPAVGQPVRAGQTLGWVDVRIGPQERLTLHDNLNTARLKEQGARKVVELQRARVERIARVSESQIVPGQQLDDARVLLAEAETQLAVASSAVALWRKALEELDRPDRRGAATYSQPLEAPAAGEVTELAARPGTSVEPGGLVARIVDFRRPLVRLDIPPALLADGTPAPVRLRALSPARGNNKNESENENGPEVEAVPVGPAPRVEAVSQFLGYWYEPVAPAAEPTASGGEGPGVLWRPGLLVKARMTPRGARVRQEVQVDGEAVLFHQGRALVYVRVRPGAFVRREVRLLGRQAGTGAWVVAARRGDGPAGLAPGEVVVTRGAQVLLSEEFRVDVDVD